MSLILTPHKSLNKAFLKVKPNRSDIEKFKSNLKKVLEHINDKESEEHHKNLVIEFLKDTYYKPDFFINTKGRSDLVIHNGKDGKSTVGVLIEVKKPGNKSEMLKKENLNTKAFQELILYYLRERITQKNLEIKYIAATNIYEWFIFDSHLFEKVVASNKKLVQQFEEFEAGRLGGKDTSFFYKEVAEPFIKDHLDSFSFTYFDIRDFEKFLTNDDLEDDKKLIALFKILSPQHLLKLSFANDSNSLDKGFYAELLHIIGLTETKDGGKKLIQRKKAGERDAASLLENAILVLDSRDKIQRLDKPSQYGETQDDRLFNVGLELVITWINRILFLKLLEAQLVAYHKGDKEYQFLNLQKIKSFDDLESLFFLVLARKLQDRNAELSKLFANVPYLNSSLFEPTELEQQTIFISNLADDKKLPLLSSSKLKNSERFKNAKELSTLEYLFEFLSAYDFSSEGSEEIQEENKTLINASVLGLIFEKINGYKDGSFFTPGFITMYMCRETIRRAVVQKFNEKKGWELKEYEELYDKIEDRKEANEIINSLKICDPAVGSGHFLVSALNEIIAIKSDLKILCDREGKRLKEYSFDVENDELVVTDEEGAPYKYNPRNKESQRVQETLFHEKQTIIENCLFGVDINPNSVKICRLRLWIELLKNAYYKSESKFTELETLPNIDINIKIGNSLISRFPLDADLKEALKKSKSKWSIDSYKMAVQQYQHAQSKEEKREMERLIEDIKSNFRTEISDKDPKKLKLNKLKGELYNLTNQTAIFGMSEKEKKKFEKDVESKSKEINKLEAEIEEIKNNKIYENAFEWRFEFPEVLNEEGDFVGFDLVIGNPPYLYRNFDFTQYKEYFNKYFLSNEGNFDLYKFFIEKIYHLLRFDGIGSYIVPNTFLSAKTYYKLRNFLISRFEINELYDLGLDVFDGVIVENIVFRLKKSVNPNNDVVLIKLDRRKVKDINDPLNSYVLSLDKLFHQEGVFNIYLDAGIEKLINKIRINTIPLGDIAYCTVGINTGYIKSKLISSNKIDESYHKVLNGRDIGPYTIDWKGDWIKYDKSFVDSFGELGRSLPPEYIFTNEKILIQRTRRGLARKLVCAYDNEKYYNLNRLSNVVITTEDYSPKYIIGLLNSVVLDYYFNKVFNEYEVKPLHISKLPIKVLNKSIQEKIIELVDSILKMKSKDKSANTDSLEKEIDKVVYQIYELTPEEIQIIESNT